MASQRLACLLESDDGFTRAGGSGDIEGPLSSHVDSRFVLRRSQGHVSAQERGRGQNEDGAQQYLPHGRIPPCASHDALHATVRLKADTTSEPSIRLKPGTTSDVVTIIPLSARRVV